jgi:hypothetical protein
LFEPEKKEAFMKRLLSMLAIGTFGWAVGPAGAQQPPPVPPILQLRNPTSLVNTYFNGFGPQVQFRGAINQLQGSVQDWQTGTATGNELAATGHASGFQTHLRYFGNLGGLRGGYGVGGVMVNPLGNSLGYPMGNPMAGQGGLPGPMAPGTVR